jgi:hypothetical protein
MYKREVLGADGKVKATWEKENGKKKVGVYREFDRLNSTTQAIWKNITKIVSAFEQKG